MSIGYLTHRLEITFWIAAVSVMKSRRAMRVLPFVLLLSLCLVSMSITSITLGRLAKDRETRPQAVQPTSGPTDTPPVATGQKNALLILADDLESPEPRLEGVWLCVFLPTAPRLTMLPLYPAALSGGHKEDLRLAGLFGLDGQKMPLPAFQDSLKAKGLWWDYMLVIDEAGIQDVVDLVGGIDLDAGHLNGIETLAYLPKAWEAPQEALYSQARLGSALCQAKNEMLEKIDSVQLIKILVNHVQANVSPTDMAAAVAWLKTQSDDHKFDCDFPTLPELFPAVIP